MPSRRVKSRSTSVNLDDVDMVLTPVNSPVKSSKKKALTPKIKKRSVKDRLGKKPVVDGANKKKKRKNRHFYHKKQHKYKKNNGGPTNNSGTTIINVTCGKTIINKK